MVLILEKTQGLMDVIHWIEIGRFDLSQFGIIRFMVGRVDRVRSKNWFMASVEDLMRLVFSRNLTTLQLWGAVIPSVDDDKAAVRDFVDKNAALQKKMFNGH